MKVKLFFHYVSYLQYPLYIAAVFFYAKFIIAGFDTVIWKNLNSFFIFFGIGISFSTLQDTTKTQNKLSKKVWENPKKGKIMITGFSVATLIFILLGTVGFFTAKESIIKEISLGLIVLGIGLIGMLKTAIEMFENHRKN